LKIYAIKALFFIISIVKYLSILELEKMNDYLGKFKYPLGIVAHDSGSTNIISELIKDIDNSKLIFSLNGPALDIISRNRRKIKNSSIDFCLENSQSLLSGTSNRDVNLEYDARKKAKIRKIMSFAIVDHWVNYKERFIRNNLEVLPDEIWVSDKYALKMAKNNFKKTPIFLIKNLYVMNEVKKILSNRRYKTSKNKTKFLYLLEPIDDFWKNSKIKGDFQALNFFIDNIKLITTNNEIEIILKPHPKESPDKYDAWCKNYSKALDIHIDKTSSLSNLISWADIVVGCQTAAMIIAMEANKKVICSLPQYAAKCKLPHEKIIHLKDLKE
jgi:hypothetical protein